MYLANNQWVPAIDQIYSFVDQSFYFIPYKDICTLLESAFYRALYAYYATRNPASLYIPDYAMVHLEPYSKYRCKQGHGKNAYIDFKTLTYTECKIDRSLDMKAISEGIYWMNLLL